MHRGQGEVQFSRKTPKFLNSWAHLVFSCDVESVLFSSAHGQESTSHSLRSTIAYPHHEATSKHWNLFPNGNCCVHFLCCLAKVPSTHCQFIYFIRAEPPVLAWEFDTFYTIVRCRWKFAIRWINNEKSVAVFVDIISEALGTNSERVAEKNRKIRTQITRSIETLFLASVAFREFAIRSGGWESSLQIDSHFEREKTVSFRSSHSFNVFERIENVYARE